MSFRISISRYSIRALRNSPRDLNLLGNFPVPLLKWTSEVDGIDDIAKIVFFSENADISNLDLDEEFGSHVDDFARCTSGYYSEIFASG